LVSQLELPKQVRQLGGGRSTTSPGLGGAGTPCDPAFPLRPQLGNACKASQAEPGLGSSDQGRPAPKTPPTTRTKPEGGFRASASEGCDSWEREAGQELGDGCAPCCLRFGTSGGAWRELGRIKFPSRQPDAPHAAVPPLSSAPDRGSAERSKAAGSPRLSGRRPAGPGPDSSARPLAGAVRWWCDLEEAGR